MLRISSLYRPAGWSLLATLALISRGNPAESDASSSTAVVESSFHQGEWPFCPPTRPSLPIIANSVWATNPIDRFVLARLEDAGLAPSPEADRAMLLRRAAYDLTGLPPTSAELAAFLADESPDAYLRVVNRLLASPRFGERWAQLWLDLVRYADTEGFKSDRLRESAFRYRDYVIDSFNNDRPFDEFIRQQLAGDELEPDNPEALIATGLLRLYPDEDNAANLFQRRQEILDDVTDTTGLALMGLTMGCAQCHDHKFDAISQTDYFRLQAFFVSMSERDLPAATPQELAAYQEELSRWENASASLRREIDDLLRPVREEIDKFGLERYEPAILACYLKPPSERSPFDEQLARMIQWRLDRKFEEDAEGKLLPPDRVRYEELTQRLAEFDSIKPDPLPTAMAVEDVGREAPPTHLLDGGNWQRPAALVEPGFPEFLGAAAAANVRLASVPRRESTTGRRTQLAAWLTRADHPLTARVIVNRLWQQHFGRGIVATPNDFGSQGEPPTHPELLDWLAMELVENGWSLKHIHRLMVTSSSYRTSSLVSRTDEATIKSLAVDRDNTLLWRANRRRLEGEAMRDAMLQVSGELKLAMHGPSVRPALPEGVSERYAWEPDRDAAERNRRSVYVLAQRNMRYPFFETFDQPDLHQSCARRAVTVTAPQSLAMLNSELTLELARCWAQRLLVKHVGQPRELIREAYRAAFSREATEEEVQLAEAFVATESQLVAVPAEEGQLPDEAVPSVDRPPGGFGIEAGADLCHALFNSTEFITVD